MTTKNKVKKIYIAPKLKKMGGLKTVTLKGGSADDGGVMNRVP